MRLESDNGQELIQELEQKRGGKITWRTFSLYYADSNGKIAENGVLIYEIDKTIWLEDFEKTPSIFGIKISEPKNYRYEKFERSFKMDEIVNVGTVFKKAAVDFVNGKTKEVKTVGKIAAFFGEPLTMLTFKDGSKIFLRLLDSNKFKK